MNLVLADTYSFFNILFDRYNIKMFEQGSNRMKKVFINASIENERLNIILTK